MLLAIFLDVIPSLLVNIYRSAIVITENADQHRHL